MEKNAKLKKLIEDSITEIDWISFEHVDPDDESFAFSDGKDNTVFLYTPFAVYSCYGRDGCAVRLSFKEKEDGKIVISDVGSICDGIDLNTFDPDPDSEYDYNNRLRRSTEDFRIRFTEENMEIVECDKYEWEVTITTDKKDLTEAILRLMFAIMKYTTEAFVARKW